MRRSSCMAIPRPGAAAMQRSFWKATADIWKRTAIRVITVCLGSGAAPVGHISADTLSTLFQKGSSIYLKYIAPEDIVVYSIDEVFIDATSYLSHYNMTAHDLAIGCTIYKCQKHIKEDTKLMDFCCFLPFSAISS